MDVIWYVGGESTIDTVNIPKLNNVGIGGPLGYQINDNLQLTLTYTNIVNDADPEDLKMNSFRVTLIFGWHKLVEGMHRLKGND